MKVKNFTQNAVLADKVRYCRGFWERLRGLLGRPKLSDTEALWLSSCRAVHTFGMRYAIDAYFLNAKNEVVAVLKNLQPNRISPYYLKARSVLEFSAGEGRRCLPGDRLGLEEER